MKSAVRARSLLGYSWAALCLVIILATFIGLGSWAQGLASVTGVQVSPWFSGGEVVRTIDHDSYKTLVHRPVFDGLFSERAQGFVQVDWVAAPHRSLPAELRERFDVDGDGKPDAAVSVETASSTTRLETLQPWVLGADELIVAEQDRILRIRLRNPHR
jgi:hypothetical protein